MYVISVETTNLDDSPLAIMCSMDKIHSVLKVLENSSSVKRYKIQMDGTPTFTKSALKYHFIGYLHPAGKAHWKFSWQENKTRKNS